MDHIIDKIMKPKEFEKDLNQRNRLYWFGELLEVKIKANDILRPIEEEKQPEKDNILDVRIKGLDIIEKTHIADLNTH